MTVLHRHFQTGIWTEDSGTSAVEFAIIVPVMLLLTFGVYEFGRFFWIQNQLQFAVEETARQSLRSSSPAITSCATSVDNTTAVTGNLAGLTVTASAPAVTLVSADVGTTDLSVAPKVCTITATYPFSFFGFLGLSGSFTAEGIAAYPCKDSSGNGSGTTCS